MPKDTVLRTKLRASIDAKRISRSGLDNAYEKLEVYEKTIKRLKKSKQDTTDIDVKKEALEDELQRVEDTMANMQLGSNIEAGGGLSGGSCAGGD